MATTLAPVDSREVVRCDHCHLVQFLTQNHCCRRCRQSLDPEPEPVVAQAESAPLPTTNGNGNGHAHLQVAFAIRNLRQRFGMSQRQLALRMKVPRTYVSKIENEKATPTLSSLERLAHALEVSVCDLLNGGNRTHEDEIRELVQDEFIAELVPYVSRLNGIQCASILAQVRDMTVRPRRMS
jgi:transcriptional regulator with XRE-family HTH domain